MPRHQTPAQQETVERVMHEFKHGELKTARGARKVKNRKQAIAIALHEAGASKNESPAENKRNLRRTKAKERRGETYRDEAEGKKEPRSDGAEAEPPAAPRRGALHPAAASAPRPSCTPRPSAATSAGRSKMDKAQLHGAGGPLAFRTLDPGAGRDPIGVASN